MASVGAKQDAGNREKNTEDGAKALEEMLRSFAPKNLDDLRDLHRMLAARIAELDSLDSLSDAEQKERDTLENAHRDADAALSLLAPSAELPFILSAGSVDSVEALNTFDFRWSQAKTFREALKCSPLLSAEGYASRLGGALIGLVEKKQRHVERILRPFDNPKFRAEALEPVLEEARRSGDRGLQLHCLRRLAGPAPDFSEEPHGHWREIYRLCSDIAETPRAADVEALRLLTLAFPDRHPTFDYLWKHLSYPYTVGGGRSPLLDEFSEEHLRAVQKLWPEVDISAAVQNRNVFEEARELARCGFLLPGRDSRSAVIQLDKLAELPFEQFSTSNSVLRKALQNYNLETLVDPARSTAVQLAASNGEAYVFLPPIDGKILALPAEAYQQVSAQLQTLRASLKAAGVALEFRPDGPAFRPAGDEKRLMLDLGCLSIEERVGLNGIAAGLGNPRRRTALRIGETVFLPPSAGMRCLGISYKEYQRRIEQKLDSLNKAARRFQQEVSKNAKILNVQAYANAFEGVYRLSDDELSPLNLKLNGLQQQVDGIAKNLAETHGVPKELRSSLIKLRTALAAARASMHGAQRINAAAMPSLAVAAAPVALAAPQTFFYVGTLGALFGGARYAAEEIDGVPHEDSLLGRITTNALMAGVAAPVVHIPVLREAAAGVATLALSAEAAHAIEEERYAGAVVEAAGAGFLLRSGLRRYLRRPTAANGPDSPKIPSNPPNGGYGPRPGDRPPSLYRRILRNPLLAAAAENRRHNLAGAMSGRPASSAEGGANYGLQAAAGVRTAPARTIGALRLPSTRTLQHTEVSPRQSVLELYQPNARISPLIRIQPQTPYYRIPAVRPKIQPHRTSSPASAQNIDPFRTYLMMPFQEPMERLQAAAPELSIPGGGSRRSYLREPPLAPLSEEEIEALRLAFGVELTEEVLEYLKRLLEQQDPDAVYRGLQKLPLHPDLLFELQHWFTLRRIDETALPEGARPSSPNAADGPTPLRAGVYQLEAMRTIAELEKQLELEPDNRLTIEERWRRVAAAARSLRDRTVLAAAARGEEIAGADIRAELGILSTFLPELSLVDSDNLLDGTNVRNESQLLLADSTIVLLNTVLNNTKALQNTQERLRGIEARAEKDALDSLARHSRPSAAKPQPTIDQAALSELAEKLPKNTPKQLAIPLIPNEVKRGGIVAGNARLIESTLLRTHSRLLAGANGSHLPLEDALLAAEPPPGGKELAFDDLWTPRTVRGLPQDFTFERSEEVVAAFTPERDSLGRLVLPLPLGFRISGIAFADQNGRVVNSDSQAVLVSPFGSVRAQIDKDYPVMLLRYRRAEAHLQLPEEARRTLSYLAAGSDVARRPAVNAAIEAARAEANPRRKIALVLDAFRKEKPIYDLSTALYALLEDSQSDSLLSFLNGLHAGSCQTLSAQLCEALNSAGVSAVLAGGEVCQGNKGEFYDPHMQIYCYADGLEAPIVVDPTCWADSSKFLDLEDEIMLDPAPGQEEAFAEGEKLRSRTAVDRRSGRQPEYLPGHKLRDSFSKNELEGSAQLPEVRDSLNAMAADFTPADCPRLKIALGLLVRRAVRAPQDDDSEKAMFDAAFALAKKALQNPEVSAAQKIELLSVFQLTETDMTRNPLFSAFSDAIKTALRFDPAVPKARRREVLERAAELAAVFSRQLSPKEFAAADKDKLRAVVEPVYLACKAAPDCTTIAAEHHLLQTAQGILSQFDPVTADEEAAASLNSREWMYHRMVAQLLALPSKDPSLTGNFRAALEAEFIRQWRLMFPDPMETLVALSDFQKFSAEVAQGILKECCSELFQKDYQLRPEAQAELLAVWSDDWQDLALLWDTLRKVQEAKQVLGPYHLGSYSKEVKQRCTEEILEGLRMHPPVQEMNYPSAANPASTLLLLAVQKEPGLSGLPASLRDFGLVDEKLLQERWPFSADEAKLARYIVEHSGIERSPRGASLALDGRPISGSLIPLLAEAEGYLRSRGHDASASRLCRAILQQSSRRDELLPAAVRSFQKNFPEEFHSLLKNCEEGLTRPEQADVVTRAAETVLLRRPAFAAAYDAAAEILVYLSWHSANGDLDSLQELTKLFRLAGEEDETALIESAAQIARRPELSGLPELDSEPYREHLAPAFLLLNSSRDDVLVYEPPAVPQTDAQRTAAAFYEVSLPGEPAASAAWRGVFRRLSQKREDAGGAEANTHIPREVAVSMARRRSFLPTEETWELRLLREGESADSKRIVWRKSDPLSLPGGLIVVREGAERRPQVRRERIIVDLEALRGEKQRIYGYLSRRLKEGAQVSIDFYFRGAAIARLDEQELRQPGGLRAAAEAMARLEADCAGVIGCFSDHFRTQHRAAVPASALAPAPRQQRPEAYTIFCAHKNADLTRKAVPPSERIRYVIEPNR